MELWKPLTDSTSIHSWLPPLGNRLEIFYPTIRNKLANDLNSWHPNDRSAKLILLPWKYVFTRGSMQVSQFLFENGNGGNLSVNFEYDLCKNKGLEINHKS